MIGQGVPFRALQPPTPEYHMMTLYGQNSADGDAFFSLQGILGMLKENFLSASPIHFRKRGIGAQHYI
jgi:hypothetical protein